MKHQKEISTVSGTQGAFEPLLTIEQASAALGQSHWTLRSLIRAGRIRCVRGISRRILIEPGELRRFVSDARQASASEAPSVTAGPALENNR